jgi:hypothetical protein
VVYGMMRASVFTSAARSRRRAPIDWKSWLEIIGLAGTFLAVVVGFYAHTNRYISPRSGLGYALGITGGSLMLLLLIYPLRKRVPGLSSIGSVKSWFRFHMILGIAGPLLVLYHSNFSLGATNSNVALICMLVVSGSGIVGRYFYTKIHRGLYGRAESLESLKAQAEALRGSGINNAVLPELHDRLDRGEKRLRALPSGGLAILFTPAASALLYRIEMLKAHSYIDRRLRAVVAAKQLTAKHRLPLRNAATRYSDRRLLGARRIAEFRSYEQLFSLWHLLHLPLFFMMLIAGIVHVFAVHLY